MGHNYIGHTYIGHNYIGHNYMKEGFEDEWAQRVELLQHQATLLSERDTLAAKLAMAASRRRLRLRDRIGGGSVGGSPPPSCPPPSCPPPSFPPPRYSPSGGMEGQPSGGMEGQPSGGMEGQPSGGMEGQPSGGMEAQPSGGMEAQPKRTPEQASAHRHGEVCVCATQFIDDIHRCYLWMLFIHAICRCCL